MPKTDTATPVNESNEGEILRDDERAALAEAVQLSRRIAVDVLRFVVRSLPALIRAACLLSAIAGATYAAWVGWLAFGADEAAYIPAACLALAPIVYAIEWRISWGGLLIAGPVAAGLAFVLTFIPEPFTQTSIVAVVALIVLGNMARRNEDKQDEIQPTEERQRLAV
jgi:hypothetical protein